MAIVDSIILGRAKGSIGNVTLSTQKGRVIAKQKATIVSNPNTVAQQEQRGKLSKAVLAWQAIGNVVKSGITALMPFSSAYNTYVSKNMDIFANAGFPNGAVSGMDLQDSFATIGRLGTLTYSQDTVDFDSYKATLDKANFNQIAKVGDKLKILVGNQLAEEFSYSEATVTQAMLDNTTPFVVFADLGLSSVSQVVSALWLETADGKESTTAKFKNY